MRTKDLEMYLGDYVILTIKGEKKIGCLEKLNKGSIVFKELPIEKDVEINEDNYPCTIIDTTLIEQVELYNEYPKD